ncbi:MAG: SAM-dependent chlorinase/fluorinase [Cyanothece sp. SIO2G6]|nr:SAM-dependent chlorinase/fluorinase [Cyanothece sp. SIO2G6]
MDLDSLAINEVKSTAVPQLLTLLTDFGLEDAYVGIMKGVILTLAPQATIVDLTHQIPPQDLWAARFNLMNAVPYLPPGTVHVAVVDPGVGSQRRGVAIQLPDCFLVGPDNGIFSGVLAPYMSQGQPITVVSLTNPEYWRSPTTNTSKGSLQPSTTFHGRDIFAPVAAHLLTGIEIHQLGQVLNPRSLVSLDLPPLQQQGGEMVGCVQYGDRFGNLITTIPADLVKAPRWHLTIGSLVVPGHATYASVELGQPLALVGSHGWVELAVNGGSARDYARKYVNAFVSNDFVSNDFASEEYPFFFPDCAGESNPPRNALIGCPISLKLLSENA